MLMIWSPHQSLNLITPLSCTSVKLISKLLLMKGLNQSYFIVREYNRPGECSPQQYCC